MATRKSPLAASASTPAPADDPDEICSIRIELLHTDPLIWRELEVPTAITLKGLHDIVQIAMGWFDCHLWEFTIAGRRFAPRMEESWGMEPAANASKVRLREILQPRKTSIDYLYDMGDSWEHRLTATKIRQADPASSYPRYVAGEWAGPPEDCGGIPGFYSAIHALANASHPQHNEVRGWLGKYDPTDTNEGRVKVAVGRIAGRRSAARKRLPRKED